MDKGYFIQYFEPGERLTEYFTLRKTELRDYEGKAYLSLELGDKTGRISGSYWGDDVLELSETLKDIDVIKVRGVVTERRGKNFFKIEKIRHAEADEFDIERLLPHGKYKPQDLFKVYKKRVSALKDEELKKLFNVKIFDDKDFSELLMKAPGGKLWHHTYLGGLLEHSLAVHRICLSTSILYPETNRDMLLAGSLLHDIGKVFELSATSHINYTVQGRLMGHIYLGAQWLSQNAQEILSPEKFEHLLHLILSHHGEGKMGSPVKPMTIEANILHHADLTDSQTNAFSRVIGREKDSGQDFSKWVKIADRFLYLKPYQEETKETVNGVDEEN